MWAAISQVLPWNSGRYGGEPMAEPDDPFRIDPERTVMRPMPGRPAVPRPAPRPAPAASASAAEDISLSELFLPGLNPLLAAAGPLFAIAVRIRGSAAEPDMPALRDRILQEFKLFQDRLRAANVPAKTAQLAHRALCALIDDLVLNTPWGAHSNWRAATLFSVFHGQVTGGDWFFYALRQLAA